MTLSFTSPVVLLEQQRLAQAQADGFSLFAINPDGDIPGFVYSIGMTQHDLYEVLHFYPDGEHGAAARDVAEVCTRMIAASQRLSRIDLLRQVLHMPGITAPSGAAVQFQMLRGDDFIHALKCYLTRAVRYREELGMPRGVLVMQREDVPTFQQVRALRMLQLSDC